jgi:dynein heavy chain
VTLLDTLSDLAPKVVGGSGGQSRDELLSVIANDVKAKCPPPINLTEVKRFKADDTNKALNIVLYQEIERYNKMVIGIAKQVKDLVLGIQGLVVITSELEEVSEYLFTGKVPLPWGKHYMSLKPLGAWVSDMMDRIEFFRLWGEGPLPSVMWFGGFTFPTGFLTALMQQYARQNGVSIDTLSWDFPIINQREEDITQPPSAGCYMNRMVVEGAAWDNAGSALCEPKPMELICPMPVIQFKPVEGKGKKSNKKVYNCPVYYYAIRTGSRERPSFMLVVDLACGGADPEHWVKRATALLLSTKE